LQIFIFLENQNFKSFQKRSRKKKKQKKKKKMKYLMGCGLVWPPVHAGCAAPAPRAANGWHKGAPQKLLVVSRQGHHGSAHRSAQPLSLANSWPPSEIATPSHQLKEI
jgi:hypothetical protein